MKALACCLLVVALASCAKRTEEKATYHIQGTAAGHPVDVTVKGTTEATTTIEPPGFLALLKAALPSPWSEILSALGVAFFGVRARNEERRRHAQTVAGIDAAREELPDEAVSALERALANKQDDSTKRAVWEMRP